MTVERRINLRLLQRRYGDRMDERFGTVAMHRASEKGMPNWSRGFTDEQFTKR